MATITQVRKRASELGATVDEHDYEVYIDAPRGQEWLSDGVHTLSVQVASTMREPAFKREALDRLLARMNYGLTPCAGQCDDDS